MAGRVPLAFAAAVVLAAAPWLLVGLGAAPFDDPGEGMHAQIARELRVGGDPLDLRLNGVRYVDKPPLLYVLLAGAFGLAGESEAVARTVPAVAALAGVGAVTWLGVRLLGPGGALAGGALLTSIGFYAYGRYVRPETLFVAALAWGFALALTGLQEERPTLVTAGLVGFGVAALAKDPLGALAPPLILGLSLALGGRLRPWRRWLPAAGVAAALALAFGWWMLVELRSPGFAWYTLVDNHVLNVARARHFPDEDVPLSALEFLTVATVGAAPWVIAAAMAVVLLLRGRRWRHPGEAAWVALALWAVAVLAVTMLSAFRLPHYGLPAYPAIALLAARGWLEGPRRTLIVVHVALFAALAIACAILWAGGSEQFTSRVLDATDVATRKAAGAGHAGAVPPWETIRPLLGVTALTFAVVAVGLGFLALRRRADGAWAPALVLIAMIAVLPCVGLGLAGVATQRAVRPLAAELARRATPGDLVVHEGPLENSGALEWYARRRPVIVDGRRSVLGFGATFAGGADILWERERLRQAWEDGRRVWLVTVRAPTRSMVAELPGARLVAEAGGRRLYVNR